LLAVHGEVGKRFVGIVLRGELCGGGVEMREGGRRPPCAHAPLRVKRAAFCVKAMADFVPDSRTGRAIVHRGGRLGIEERRVGGSGGGSGGGCVEERG